MNKLVLKIMSLIFSLSLLTSPLMAQNRIATHREHMERTKAAKENLAIKTKFSYCVRNLIERSGGGVNEFDQVIDYLDNAFQVKSRTTSSFHYLYNSCQSLKSDLAHLSAITPVERLQFLRANKDNIHPQSFVLLSAILDPKITCQKAGLSGGAGAGLGIVQLVLGAQVELATCQSTTGRKWIEVRGGVAKGVGINIYVMFETGEDTRNLNNGVGPLGTGMQDYSIETMGLIAGMQTQTQDGPRFENKKIGGGFGAALGLSFQEGRMITLPIISLGSDDTFIVKQTMAAFR